MKQNQTVFEQFRESLYDESLRGAWELESLRYGIMARLGLDEPDALELACLIVASDKPQSMKPPVSAGEVTNSKRT